MRVLQIHNRYREPGGEDQVVEAECRLLRSAGHDVVQHQVENPDGVAGTAAALALAPWNPRSFRAVGRIVDEARPDVAHAHNTWYALSPSIVTALHRRRVPVVVTLHNFRLMCANAQLFRDGGPCHLCVGSHAFHGVRHRCYRDSLPASAVAATTIAVNGRFGTWRRGADLYLVPTGFVRDQYVAGGFPAEKIVVKPNFVEDPGLRETPPSQSRTVLYVGRVSVEKGADVLLRAWDAAAVEGLELTVVGDGPERERLEVQHPSVRFTGRVSSQEVGRLMMSARALVFPSMVYETFGRAIVEALAARMPVLASDHGAPAEVVGPLGASCLVPPGDVDGWARAIAGLASDAFVDDVGRRGRSHYETSFTPETGLELLVGAYDRARADRRSGFDEQQ